MLVFNDQSPYNGTKVEVFSSNGQKQYAYTRTIDDQYSSNQLLYSQVEIAGFMSLGMKFRIVKSNGSAFSNETVKLDVRDSNGTTIHSTGYDYQSELVPFSQGNIMNFHCVRLWEHPER